MKPRDMPSDCRPTTGEEKFSVRELKCTLANDDGMVMVIIMDGLVVV